MKNIFKTVHKYISLSLVLVWSVQILSGLGMMFYRDIEDLSFPDVKGAADYEAIGDSLTQLMETRPGASIPYVYTFDSHFNRFDVYVADIEGSYSVIRMDSDGEVLRELPSNPEVLDAGFFELVLELHTKLWAGDAGHTLVGITGIFLLINIVLGLKMAWPRKRGWSTAFKVNFSAPKKQKNYALHRSIGLASALPLFLIVATGVAIVWKDDIEALLLDEASALVLPEMVALEGPAIPLYIAIDAAMAEFPGSQVSVFNLPTKTKPYYKIRLLQPGELRRYYGNTSVYVNAGDATIIATEDALALPFSNRVLNAFYPLHTGGAFGAAGKIVYFIVGCSLMVMIIIGLRLWWLRRP